MNSPTTKETPPYTVELLLLLATKITDNEITLYRHLNSN